jgi:hypothetical protein
MSKASASNFCSFFRRLLHQLDIKCGRLPNKMQADDAFQGLTIPRFVFPGTISESSLLDNIGIYERSANKDNIDATLHGVQGTNRLDRIVGKLYIEAEHRKSVSTFNVMEVIKKLLKDDGSIGIMITASSSKFTMNGDKPSEPLERLKQFLDGTKKPTKKSKWAQLESKLGVGYFVNVDHNGVGSILPFTFDPTKHGRFILITLPELT